MDSRGDAEFLLEGCQLLSRAQAFLDGLQFLDSFVQRDFEILKVDRLDEKVVSATIHGDPNILHIAVSRYDDGFEDPIDVRQPQQQR